MIQGQDHLMGSCQSNPTPREIATTISPSSRNAGQIHRV